MFSFVKNHPFAVDAFFKDSLVVTFAVPKTEVQHLIPECLELDTFDDKWAFIAVAMVNTTNLRPTGFPKFTGNDFFLVGYRVFVRYRTNAGKKLRGLYILKSETDNKTMQYLGDIFTHYKYSTTDVLQTSDSDTTQIQSSKSRFNIVIEHAASEFFPLPPNSPFKDWKEARRFAGPLPFTFSYNNLTKTVLIIEGVREHWTPTPVKVRSFVFPYLQELKIGELILANAFIIKNISYHWKKGRTEKWNP